MKTQHTQGQFQAKLLRPKNPGDTGDWAFVILPAEISASLPRRGRTSVAGYLNGQAFIALLEPDGNKSHWLKIEQPLLAAAGVVVGELAQFEVAPIAEPEPALPEDLQLALRDSPAARASWDATTTLARLDWIHWIVSAKQARTRAKRIADACEMLAGGKLRVCCFDPSGFYSKAFSAPEAEG